MKKMALIISLILCANLLSQDATRVRPADQKSDDARLEPARTLNSYFPFAPAQFENEWTRRKQELREQILVANGLWPLPEKTPLNPTIHGKIDRDEYTIEKVFFASTKGHYVTGNLYRPKGKSGKLPAVLFAHGHWANGRLHDAGIDKAKKDMASGGEKTIESGRYPLQALPAMLARLGCVVFVYDMVGVADSKAIGHATGFADVQGELRLQSAMGLQTWNSIRAYDFLTSLPDVDPKRVGMTGASGGGTQTFITCAIDDRPAVAFPAVMVSTGMQGGCVCENCSYLRIGAGNVDFAAMFAPKPLGMSAANDWTREIETKGLPELKAHYKLFGFEDRVKAKSFLQFDHNYNQVSREVMYDWMNQHLGLGIKGPIAEKPFVPVPPAELSVFDAAHPMPKDSLNAPRLRELTAETSDKQMDAMMPKDAASLAEFRKVAGTAMRVMIGDYPNAKQLALHVGPNAGKIGNYAYHKAIFGRQGEGDRVPSIGIVPPKPSRNIAIWIHPKGKQSLFEGEKLVPAAQAIYDARISIMAIDVLQIGEQAGEPRKIDARYAGYTYGYNRPLLAEQVRDIVTAVSTAKNTIGAEKVYLLGWESMGPAVVIANAICGSAVDKTAADLNQFRFDRIDKTDDPMMLPGAVKYGGLGAFAAMCAPGELLLHNHMGTSSGRWTESAYKAAGAEGKLRREPRAMKPEDVAAWVVR
jgi:dienelactone hydrolase